MRHRWDRTEVEVPWSVVPAGLYTCRHCGMQKQNRETQGGMWETDYGVPQEDGSLLWSTLPHTPPCPGPTEEACLNALHQLGLFTPPPAPARVTSEPEVPACAPLVLRAVLALPGELTFREIAQRCGLEDHVVALAVMRLEALGVLESDMQDR